MISTCIVPNKLYSTLPCCSFAELFPLPTLPKIPGLIAWNVDTSIIPFQLQSSSIHSSTGMEMYITTIPIPWAGNMPLFPTYNNHILVLVLYVHRNTYI